MIPAMQMHLFDCKSSNEVVQRFAPHKLEVCMSVMSELRRTYWGADFILKLFERAQAKLREMDYESRPQPAEVSQPFPMNTFPQVTFENLTPQSAVFSHADSRVPSGDDWVMPGLLRTADSQPNIGQTESEGLRLVDMKSCHYASIPYANNLTPRHAAEGDNPLDWLFSEDFTNAFLSMV